MSVGSSALRNDYCTFVIGGSRGQGGGALGGAVTVPRTEVSTRRERDTLGETLVPADALWGAQTQRAIENYPISGYRAFPAFIRAFVRIKRAAALANAESGRLDPKLKDAIVAACDEVLAGKHVDQFVVDVFHSGAGVSFHMNVNEVLANRANQILGGGLGTYEHVNPNDHVNMSQSTNDTTPTAMRLAALELTKTLCGHLDKLAESIDEKATRYADCVKPGRTHLQDAVPITFGQEFSGWAERIRGASARLHAGRSELTELGIGGTAAGAPAHTGSKVPRRGGAPPPGLDRGPHQPPKEPPPGHAPGGAVPPHLRRQR